MFECRLISGKTAYHVKWLLCNAFYELEYSACDQIPNLLPIGPLRKTNINSKKFTSNSSSLHREYDLFKLVGWKRSKFGNLYVAFGSLAAFSQYQFKCHNNSKTTQIVPVQNAAYYFDRNLTKMKIDFLKQTMLLLHPSLGFTWWQEKRKPLKSSWLSASNDSCHYPITHAQILEKEWTKMSWRNYLQSSCFYLIWYHLVNYISQFEKN